VAVYTQPDRPAGRGRKLLEPPVKSTAQRYGIPVEQPDTLKDEEAAAKLAAWTPDAVVVCAYGQILTQAVLDIPPRQCLNVHYSLLPRHRGATPAAGAILEGDDFTGVSVQLVRMKLDTGPVLASAAVPVLPYDTTLSLTQKLSFVGAGMISEVLGGWLRGERQPVQQDESRATYIRQISKREGEVDWREPAVTIWRKIRAYYPWPGCFSSWRGKMIKFTAAEPVMPDEGEEVNATAGTVTALEDGFGVVTGAGILKLLRVQPEGKKEMAAKEYLRGHRDILGAVLPS
jgi:methionyl-tRNA formyltransferase